MTDKEDTQALKALLPAVGIGTAIVVGIGFLGRALTERRAYAQNGQYIISVRYPGQWDDIRSFVQPDNPDVLAVYSRIGPDAWQLFDFVCRNVSYRSDTGEFWMAPSETLRGNGDCEDTSLLLCSLLRNFTDAKVVLGDYCGFGHAWVSYKGQILETTYTQAHPVRDPLNYCPYCMFNESEVLELWPGALAEAFEIGRDETTKLGLMATTLGVEP